VNRDAGPLSAISCGIFRKEIERLDQSVLGGMRPVFLDSMMHMRPAALDVALSRIISKHPGERFLLIYGDCSPHIQSLSARPGVSRVEGTNCCEILLGRDAYRELRKEGVFFFLPEWTERWKDVFLRELGLTAPDIAQEFMHEFHKRLMYLDTGVDAIPKDTLEEISKYFGIPVEINAIGLECFSRAVDQGLRRLNRNA
jgi:hypothetical protein